MKSYKELLRDPRWQKKRLEIFERDNWRCTKCQNGAEELHAHHKRYIKGRKPWEYPNEMIVTLCDTHHKQVHGIAGATQGHSLNHFDHFCPEITIPDLSQEPINGVVINWTDESDMGFAMFDFIPWTGKKLRENHADRNMIYVCVDKNGKEFLIDNGCSKGFLFPENFEVDQVTFRQFTTKVTNGELLCWLNTVRDLVRQGAEFV